MSLLEDKYVDINSIVDCEGGQKRFYGLPIRDSHLGDGAITVKDAFAKAATWRLQTGRPILPRTAGEVPGTLHRFRLDQMTGWILPLHPADPSSRKPTSRSWSKTTIPFMAHGYEELVTPPAHADAVQRGCQ